MKKSKKEVEEMNISVDRPCTIIESLEQSLKEMKLMRSGELSKNNWDDFAHEMRNEINGKNGN